nr:hypothetical protein [Saccharothrix variisporea]
MVSLVVDQRVYHGGCAPQLVFQPTRPVSQISQSRAWHDQACHS